MKSPIYMPADIVRHPRTTAEAFKGCDYACPIERPAPKSDRVFGIVAVLALLLLCAACTQGWVFGAIQP